MTDPGKGKCPTCGCEVNVCYVCGKYDKFLTQHKYKGKTISLCHHHEDQLQCMIKDEVNTIIEKHIDDL